MERLASVVHRAGSRYQNSVEQDPHTCIAGDLIEQMLYASRRGREQEAEETKMLMCEKLDRLEMLPVGAGDSDFWVKLLQVFFAFVWLSVLV